MNNSYHVELGRHSLIPDCCIRFFIVEWMPGLNTNKLYKRAIDGWGYVPCPKCLNENHKIKIRICEKDCGRDCSDDFREKWGEHDSTYAIVRNLDHYVISRDSGADQARMYRPGPLPNVDRRERI